MTPSAPRTPTHPSPAAATGNYTAVGQEPEDIQRDIQHTRAEMSETLDALGQRLNPDYIKGQVKDSVRETAHDAGTTMIDTIKENPIPALVAGLSVGWLIMNAGKRDHGYDEDGRRYYASRYARAGYARGYTPYPTGADAGRTYERYETGYARGDSQDASLKDKAGDAADQARQKAEGAADRLGDLAGSAAHHAQDLGHEAQYYGRRATNWMGRTMEENPIAVGALALAAGALVGLAVPGTRKEDRLMGRASDDVVEQAKSAAQEKMEQAKAVAQETAEDVKDHAKEAAQDARRHAKEHDLDEPPKTVKSGPSASGSSDGSGGSTAGTSAGTTAGTTGGTPRDTTTGTATGGTAGTTPSRGNTHNR